MPSVPVVPEGCSHVLAEFDCLDPLLSALRLDSGRLKCTCLAVSRKWLALGTSAGGLHLIQREGWKQKLILTHKEGSITHVACCPHDEDFIAVATSQGLVVVWELQLERRGRPERVSMSWEHRGHAVTSLCWDTSTLRVFVGDSGGKVSFLRAGSSKLGKGPFVIFPVQTVTTVDSRVVQLGYQDGRLLVSSLSRCYLCDTEREKFWRVGNKERDGEYGACFFPQSRGLLLGQPALIYSARPGSRIWEVNFSGEVLSTHQFKQLLACPPLPLITHRNEPRYNPEQRTSQSLVFSKLLHLGDQHLLSWTDSAVYVFTPHSGQVLLWTEVKDVLDVAVYRNELFCLHGNGRLSHFSLLSAERCVERLLRRESWSLAAVVCCMFQHAVAAGRARKHVPIERLEHLRSQLGPGAPDLELSAQLEEVVSKLEPPDSASSSRRSSISSHESFNILDCGIYRVISRRGSQSEEESGSLINPSTSEEERLKEFGFAQEDDQMDHDPQSGERLEAERSEQGLQFHLPLSFRHKPPRIALQAVKDSVSSFVKKTTEKINTLQMNSDLRQKPESREGGQADNAAPPSEDVDSEVNDELLQAEAEMQELRAATERAVAQIQDPLVLLDPISLTEALLDWLPVLERVLGPGDEKWDGEGPGPEGAPLAFKERLAEEEEEEEEEEKENPDDLGAKAGEGSAASNGSPLEPVRLEPPKPVQADLLSELTQLATLYAELSCFRKLRGEGAPACAAFLRRYFFLLDRERVRRMCLLCHQEQPEVQTSFAEAMLDATRSSRMVEVIQRGDLLKSLRSLRELQPWSAPPLLAHLRRLYEKHGEAAVRSFSQFHPTVAPADVATMAQRSHFLAYLDNLVQSQPEDHRLSFLQSLLGPDSQKQDWLELALTHDAPQRCDTVTPEGNPRWHSHLFSWGYGRLLSLLIRLPADLPSKQRMAEACRSHGHWAGYLRLCHQLQLRADAFAAICHLDDISLLQDSEGMEPRTVDEWKLLIRLSRPSRPHGGEEGEAGPGGGVNGSGRPDDPEDGGRRIDPESLTLMLARTAGPDAAVAVLEECGVQPVLSPRSQLVLELLRVTEKRQRAMIQMMLERCDRFLWSQQA